MSNVAAGECIKPDPRLVKSSSDRFKQRTRPVLLTMKNPTCRLLFAHGQAMTNVLQRRMLDTVRVNDKCGNDRNWRKMMNANKAKLRRRRKELKNGSLLFNSPHLHSLYLSHGINNSSTVKL